MLGILSESKLKLVEFKQQLIDLIWTCYFFIYCSLACSIKWRSAPYLNIYLIIFCLSTKFDSVKKNWVLLLLRNQMHIVRFELFFLSASSSVDTSEKREIFVSNIFLPTSSFIWFLHPSNLWRVQSTNSSSSLTFFSTSKSIMQEQLLPLSP